MLNLSLRVKMALAAGLLLVAAAGLLAVALVGIFRGVSVDAAESRFGFIVAESRTAVENGINLGFFLDELNRLRGTQDILEQEMARDPAVERIYAFDQSGTVLFSTDVTQVGEPVDPLVRREAEAADSLWSTSHLGVPVVGVPLVSTLGRTIGTVALRYDATVIEGAMLRAWYAIGFRAALLGAVAILIAGVASWWLLTPVVRTLKASEASLREAVTGDMTAASALAPNDPDMVAMLDGANRVRRTLGEEEADLSRLDEAA